MNGSNPDSRFLTDEASRAVSAAEGALFEAIVSAVISQNPSMSPAAAEDLLVRLLGPSTLAELYDARPSSSGVPLTVVLGGRAINVLELDPLRHAQSVAAYEFARVAILQEFGGLEAVQNDIRQLVAQGGNARDAEMLVVTTFYKCWQEGMRTMAESSDPEGTADADQENAASQEVWIGPLLSENVPLLRRWGYVANSGISQTECVLLGHLGKRLNLFLQDADGHRIEMEQVNGVITTVSGAYEIAVDWACGIIAGSAKANGPCRRITIVDTTNEDECFEMGEVWLASDGIRERRAFDPDTLTPYTSE